jgi:hypothetical protein
MYKTFGNEEVCGVKRLYGIPLSGTESLDVSPAAAEISITIFEGQSAGLGTDDTKA